MEYLSDQLEHSYQSGIWVTQFPFVYPDVETLNHIQRENLAHLLATMHLAIRQLDGEEQGPGQYRHLTNTTYEKFVERLVFNSY